MILRMKNTGGTLVPLDVFEDFEVKYTHQFEDSKTLTGKKIPYTSNFKIPLTDNNRELCGIPFDITQPKTQKIDGDVIKNDGTVMFTAVYTVKNQMVNVLEPYISISLMDSLSYAISELSKSDLSDLLTGLGTKFTFNETWLYNAPNDVQYPLTAPFVFPFFNWNNKDTTFAYDPTRELTQLQPTFIVSHFIKQIFNHVGVDVQSQYLFSDNEILNGITSEELGLMLPVTYWSDHDSKLSVGAYCRGASQGVPTYLDRSTEVATSLATSPRIKTEDMSVLVSAANGMKLNWMQYVDHYSAWQPQYESVFSSMVDGKISLKITNNNLTPKLKFIIGGYHNSDTTDASYVDPNVPKPMEDLSVYIVKTGLFPRNDEVVIGTREQFSCQDYDWAKKVHVGNATHVGIEQYGFNFEWYYGNAWEVDFFPEVLAEFDVEAGKDLNFAFVFGQKEGTTFSAVPVMIQAQSPYNQNGARLTIKDNFIRYDLDGLIVENDEYDRMHISWYNQHLQHLNLEFSYPEPTELPPISQYEHNVNGLDRTPVQVDLAVSYKNHPDKYKLLDIVKMVMERFNLDLFSRSDGSIHLDTAENRTIGTFEIGHLIDEGVDVTYNYNELGLLTMTDSSPSFYDDDFNRLDKHETHDENRDEETVAFKTAIVNDQMFEDRYDDSAYDLLKAKNDSNYWGISDRPQVTADELKPTFCFLSRGDNKVKFPAQDNSFRYKGFWTPVLEESDFTIASSDIGFFNYFIEPNVSTVTKSVATSFLKGFDLVSFENNVILPTNTLYNHRWDSKVKTLMDNDTVSISLNIYLSPDDFLKLKDFPTVNYFGADWRMMSFSDYPISSKDGGIVTLNLVKIEELTVDPPVLYEYVYMHYNGTTGVIADACEASDSNIGRYHDGANAIPVAGDKFYTDAEGINVFDGGNRYYKLVDHDISIQIDSLGVMVGTSYACPVNLLPNGQFDNATGWEMDANWSIQDGRAKHYGDNTVDSLSADTNLLAGNQYRLTLYTAVSEPTPTCNQLVMAGSQIVADQHFAFGETIITWTQSQNSTKLYFFGCGYIHWEIESVLLEQI